MQEASAIPYVLHHCSLWSLGRLFPSGESYDLDVGPHYCVTFFPSPVILSVSFGLVALSCLWSQKNSPPRISSVILHVCLMKLTMDSTLFQVFVSLKLSRAIQERLLEHHVRRSGQYVNDLRGFEAM